MPDPNLSDRPVGCEQCPKNIDLATDNKFGKTIRHNPMGVGFAIFVGLFLIGQSYTFKINRPNHTPKPGEIAEIGAYILETKEPNYLIFGIGLAAMATALGISIDPILKLLPGGKNA